MQFEYRSYWSSCRACIETITGRSAVPFDKDSIANGGIAAVVLVFCSFFLFALPLALVISRVTYVRVILGELSYPELFRDGPRYGWTRQGAYNFVFFAKVLKIGKWFESKFVSVAGGMNAKQSVENEDSKELLNGEELPKKADDTDAGVEIPALQGRGAY